MLWYYTLSSPSIILSHVSISIHFITPLYTKATFTQYYCDVLFICSFLWLLWATITSTLKCVLVQMEGHSPLLFLFVKRPNKSACGALIINEVELITPFLYWVKWTIHQCLHYLAGAQRLWGSILLQSSFRMVPFWPSYPTLSPSGATP